MTWRNDPAVGAVPAIGHGTVDVARRTQAGEAVVYNGEVDELVKFLGDDDLLVVDKVIYRRTAEGPLTPLATIPLPTILIRPPAGDWFTVSDAEFQTDFAIHVNAPSDAQRKYAKPAKKAPAKKAAAKKAAPKK